MYRAECCWGIGIRDNVKNNNNNNNNKRLRKKYQRTKIRIESLAKRKRCSMWSNGKALKSQR